MLPALTPGPLQVEPGERVRAYAYGRDKVPFAKEVEEQLQYPPKGAGSSLDLVGFLPADAVPRYYYMSVRCQQAGILAQSATTHCRLSTASHVQVISP